MMSRTISVILLCAIYATKIVSARPFSGDNLPKPNPDCSVLLCRPPSTCIYRPKDPLCVDVCEIEAACVAPVRPTTAATGETSPASNNRTCPANEEFKECGTACEPSCSNPNPEVCTEQCVVGCQCRSGFYRNDQNVCVSTCPGSPTTTSTSNRTCPANEEYKECGTACEPSCRRPNPGICTLQCVIGCQCKSGFYRDDENVCVSNCSDSLSSELTCANVRCRDGYECRQETINCVRAPCPQPRPQCVPIDTPQITCANVRCPAGTECQQVPLNCLLPPCPQPPPECVKVEQYNPCAATTCPVGSDCRVRQVVCVRAPCNPVAECVPQGSSQGKCGEFESFRECASQCEPTCSNKNPVCILSCAPGRCQCNIGFYRNSDGRCVTEADCDGNTNPY